MSNHEFYSNSSFDVANEFRRDVLKWKAEIDTLNQDLLAKEKIEARIYDLYRNNDLFRGLIEKQVDSIVGSKVILQANPNYEALGVTSAEAKQWAKNVEREFHTYVNSPENWITADRSMNFTQLMRSACRMKIMTGEIIASREWRQSPLGYKTCVNLVSSNRVKTPKDKADKVFHGVELDRYGAATAYHIQVHKPLAATTGAGVADVKYTSSMSANSAKQIKRYRKYNTFGWLQIYHVYEPFKPEYPRGISRIASTLLKIKQLSRYHEADLDKAIIATSYVYAIKSDEDPETVADMLSGVGNGSISELNLDDSSGLSAEDAQKRQDILADLTKRKINLTGGQVIHLFKGEDIKVMGAPNTIQSSASYAKGHARSISTGMGVSYEYGTGDLEGINFSGAQMSLGIYEHSANIDRQLYIYGFALLIFRAWLDEAIDRGTVKTLGGKAYWPNKEHYARAGFSGVRRVHLDPVKKENSDNKGLANLTKSRTQITNDSGDEFEVLTQDRADEARNIINNIKDVVQDHGITLSDAIITKVAIDIVAGASTEAPEEILNAENVQEIVRGL